VTVLFVMQHGGFTFYFDSTLRLLAERGHRVIVAYERPQDAERLERLCAAHPQISHQPLPPRKGDRRVEFLTALRTFQDYLRYLEPRYATATYLRGRVEEKVPVRFVRLARAAQRTGALAVLQAALRTVERSLDPPEAVRRFVAELAPDVVLVTPLVDIGSRQVDYVKAAQALGIPTGACIASWDNLTNKGLLRIVPDRVFVWNETQRDEAVTLHRVPRDRVVVTGAPAFDHWFRWQPSATRDAFCRASGLDPGQPYVLFVGSTVGIAAEEPAFVRRWLARLRAADRPELRRLGVLVRPHPKQWERWKDVDLSGTANTAVQQARAPVDAASRSAYFDALFHSHAVVGVNTSAMIEAAIVGRRVYTLLAPEFADTQEGTLHFHYLTAAAGGPLHVAGRLEEHFEQLAAALASPDVAHPHQAFVRAFVRPHGLDVAATPLLADAIEGLAARRPASAGRSVESRSTLPAEPPAADAGRGVRTHT
jgi:hypothetical protein